MRVQGYARLIDFCITQLKAQGPSRTCNESKEEEEEVQGLALDDQVLCNIAMRHCCIVSLCECPQACSGATASFVKRALEKFTP